MHELHDTMQPIQPSMTDIRNVTPTPRLEITTPAVRNPGVEPGGVGRENKKSNIKVANALLQD